MAKELPYFKFEPSEWLEGEIQVCRDITIVCFANLCSGYWLKLGCISYAFALHKYCRKDESVLEELITNGVISISNDSITIDFLDKQLNEFQETSEKRRIAANKRWSNASALQMQSKSNAIREEKRREDERKEEKRKEESKPLRVFDASIQNCYNQIINFFPEDVRPRTEKSEEAWKEEIRKLIEIDGYTDNDIIHVTKLAREDSFWSKNFLSITKLRSKDKHGVKYIVVFKNNFINNRKANGQNRKQELADALFKKFNPTG